MSFVGDALRKYLDRGMMHTENFAKLRIHMRYSKTGIGVISENASLVMSVYAETATGDSWQIAKNSIYRDCQVTNFIKDTLEEINGDLNTSVLIQIAPRLSIIVKNHPKWGDMEFQFLNMSITKLFDMFASGTVDCPPYPGIEGILLLKPAPYQENMNDRDLPHMPEAHLYKPDQEYRKRPEPYSFEEPVKSFTNEQNTQNKTNVELMTETLIRNGLSTMQAQAEALKNDVNDQLTPTLEYSPDMETALSIKKLVEERNHERSPFREGDNELQKKIAKNELDDSSLNVLETLPDESSDLIDAADANEENLNDLFGTDEEEIPAPEIPEKK